MHGPRPRGGAVQLNIIVITHSTSIHQPRHQVLIRIYLFCRAQFAISSHHMAALQRGTGGGRGLAHCSQFFLSVSYCVAGAAAGQYCQHRFGQCPGAFVFVNVNRILRTDSSHGVQLKLDDDQKPTLLRTKPHSAHGNTPVMAWSSWYAYGGGSDLNETNVVRTAKLMVEKGLVDAGYVYLNLDDAWLAPTRDRFGQLRGDPKRFPSGIKALVRNVKAVDPRLKLGLYGDLGLRTCMGYPGQFEHEYQDAATIAAWGIEFWKYGQCWHKFPLVDILALEAYSEGLPHTISLSNSNALALNVRGMSAVGQDSDFAGDRIANFTGSSNFVRWRWGGKVLIGGVERMLISKGPQLGYVLRYCI
eukprot:SAG31_NODE_5832_length_2304_cov_1.511111_1_plen_360_part_00